MNTEREEPSRIIERRKKPRKVWAIKRDRGAMLEWKVDPRQSTAQESDDDPLARTYNFLQKLSVPGMAIEDETPLRRDGRNPYDSARAFKNKKPVPRK